MLQSVELEVILRINRYFNALDARDFDYCLDCFTPIFDADYTSMVGGDVNVGLDRSMNMMAWKVCYTLVSKGTGRW